MIAAADRPMVSSAWLDRFAPGQPQPKPGDGADKCRCFVCGAPWVAERPGTLPHGRVTKVAKLHTVDGWWP
jgi:hypothetical protein